MDVSTDGTSGGAVLVTGASGFLGVHVVAHLLERGLGVHALVRSRERLRDHLRPLGVEADDPRVVVHEGDMTDRDAVREAVQGCRYAVHAAATFSYRRRDAQRMLRENARGTETVLDAAAEAGCTGIVHVSSTVALLRPGATQDHQSPVGESVGPYTASKCESERVARRRQEAGVPVAIVNPGGILGPHDPYLGESNEVTRDILRGRVPMWPRGRVQWVDVRDTAEVVVAALQRPGRRYLVPGESVAAPHPHLSEVTGRRLPVVRVPLWTALPVARLGYATGWPFLPHAAEAMRMVALDTTVDASATVADLGVTGRPLHDSMRDTIRWLVEAGHLSAGHAGRALPDAEAARP